jgi:molybdopterin synthase catalytic subunit
VLSPSSGNDWVSLTPSPLPLEQATTWVVRPDCGAVVVFAGTVRDHADGRPGVSELEYEAYTAQVEPRLAAIVADVRRRWPETGRVALLHRVGVLAVTDVSVVVAVSAPHRAQAFDAARYGIDTLKATVPIWKRETWDGGSDWGLDAHPLDGHSVQDPSFEATGAVGHQAGVGR